MKTFSKSQEELIKVRPNAENGLWLGLLLPIAIISSYIKYSNESSSLYRSCFLFTLVNKRYFIFPTVAVSCIFHIFNHGTFLCCYSGILSSIGFYTIYMFSLRKCPWSFTLGEALFCAQGFTIFLYSTLINLYNAIYSPLKTDLQISTIVIQLLRNLNIPPLGTSLQDGFMVFSDEKDVGNVALTPMYLLVGCAIPLWVHPIPCDVTNSAMFNILPLISGLLSVGIGDTMASYVGKSFGKHKWAGSNKTIEGTVACMLSQFLTVYLLFKLGYYNLQQNDVIRISVAVITVALVEAKTTQVDNIVLPLLMYSILL
ncbi:hypothetical protein QE152_g31862 [Popillia japonica]|uniref:dolichol kinase n=1 Tax=Popillia japonica TaxID=7064 RepID=A0AAW1J0M7_POPJA